MVAKLPPFYIIKEPINMIIYAAIHATTHWLKTTQIAHLPPSSLFIEVIAATHGV